jgi:DnaD/phage-associated family protein
MAKYRQVHTTFWGDAFVLDLTPEEKYFYLFLMTNDRTTQCGIYELPKRVIEMHTGYNRETVEKLLERFVGYGKIMYNDATKEIMMRNWAKYNFINSPKVKACIVKELNEIKFKDFVKGYLKELERFGYGIDTVSIDLGEEEEQEEEEEEEEEEQESKKEVVVDKNAFRFYGDNFGFLTPHLSDKLSAWLDDFDGSDELLIKAMEIAIEQNVIKFSYVEGILRGWSKRNVKTLADVQALQMEKQNSNNGAGGNDRTKSIIQSDSEQSGGYDQFSL